MISLADPTLLLNGALAFLRIGGILFALPVFGDSPTPIRARVLAALAMTFGLYPLIPPGWAPPFDVGALTISGYVLSELGIGLLIGFVARIAFDGMLTAAAIVSYQMGFGTSNLFLPDAQANMDSFTAFHRMICMLVFLGLNLHHIFFDAAMSTFKLIPGGMAHFHGNMGELLIALTGGIFVTAVQMAAPIVVALLFTMAALGLVARTVPQMNVFTLSFPASFFIGLAVYIAMLPFFPEWMREHIAYNAESIADVVKAMGR